MSSPAGTSGGGELEGLNGVAFIYRDDDGVGLAHQRRNLLLGLLQLAPQAFAAQRVHRLILKLALHVPPAQIGADAAAGGVQAVPGGNGQHQGVAMHSGPMGAGGFVDMAFRQSAGLAGIRHRFGAENHIAEGAVVTDIPRRCGQQVELGPSRRRAAVQGAFSTADSLHQRRLHIAIADALPAGFVVHLLQVGAVAQPASGDNAGCSAE